MSETTNLILEFFDEDNNIKSLVIRDPKPNLTIEAVTAVMETIIDKDVIRTASGSSLVAVSNAYYKTTTITNLTSEDAE